MVFLDAQERALAEFPGSRVELADTGGLSLAGYSWRSSSHDDSTTWHSIDAWYKAEMDVLADGVMWIRTWAPNEVPTVTDDALLHLAAVHLRDIVLARTPPVFPEDDDDDSVLFEVPDAIWAEVSLAKEAAEAEGADARIRVGTFESFAGTKDSTVYTVVRQQGLPVLVPGKAFQLI